STAAGLIYLVGCFNQNDFHTRVSFRIYRETLSRFSCPLQLAWSEAANNDHLKARSTVITAHGVQQAAPAPRFSRTPAGPVRPPPAAATPIDEINW
ncbi:hypothetical protein ABLN64_10750, partial [Mycobacterium tuberculosis]